MKQDNYKDYILNRSFKYSLDIIKFIDCLNNKDLSVQILSKQLVRSATSVGANIMEAQAGSSTKDFANFITYALKSANESFYWLKLLSESKKASNSEYLLQESEELAKILGATLSKIRSKSNSKL